ncbi:hypothetical protein LXL04_007688 [Taraxacum kok-saghyz]
MHLCSRVRVGNSNRLFSSVRVGNVPRLGSRIRVGLANLINISIRVGNAPRSFDGAMGSLIQIFVSSKEDDPPLDGPIREWFTVLIVRIKAGNTTLGYRLEATKSEANLKNVGVGVKVQQNDVVDGDPGNGSTSLIARLGTRTKKKGTTHLDVLVQMCRGTPRDEIGTVRDNDFLLEVPRMAPLVAYQISGVSRGRTLQEFPGAPVLPESQQHIVRGSPGGFPGRTLRCLS